MSEDNTTYARSVLEASLDRQQRTIWRIEKQLELLRSERELSVSALELLDTSLAYSHPDPRRRSLLGRLRYLLGGR